MGGDPALGVGADRLSTGSIARALKPWLIADLLILNDEMPRSLATLLRQSRASTSTRSALAYGRQGPPSARPAASATGSRTARWTTIFQQGLHEFIRANSLPTTTAWASIIAKQYLDVAVHDEFWQAESRSRLFFMAVGCNACMRIGTTTYRYDPPAERRHPDAAADARQS